MQIREATKKLNAGESLENAVEDGICEYLHQYMPTNEPMAYKLGYLQALEDISKIIDSTQAKEG